MQKDGFFKDVEGIMSYLHEIGEGTERDWKWEEGFICGLATAGMIDTDEEDTLMRMIKIEEEQS